MVRSRALAPAWPLAVAARSPQVAPRVAPRLTKPAEQPATFDRREDPRAVESLAWAPVAALPPQRRSSLAEPARAPVRELRVPVPMESRVVASARVAVSSR